jgi:hypothetical protein
VSFKDIAAKIDLPMLALGFGGYSFLFYLCFICSVIYRRGLPGIIMLTVFNFLLLFKLIEYTYRLLKKDKKLIKKISVCVFSVLFISVAAIMTINFIKLNFIKFLYSRQYIGPGLTQ